MRSIVRRLLKRERYSENDVRLLRRYQVRSRPRQGHVTDFVGSTTDIRFGEHMARLGGVVEGLPFPGSFHAHATEWIAALSAVDSANSKFVMAELGAGYGPWTASMLAACRTRGIGDFHGVAVEADKTHCSWISDHLRDNGLPDNQFLVIHGAVGTTDGTLLFRAYQIHPPIGARQHLTFRAPKTIEVLMLSTHPYRLFTRKPS